MRLDKSFDMVGRECPLIFGEPCPGRSIWDGAGGCPHWQRRTMQFVLKEPEEWVGCSILMNDVVTNSYAASLELCANSVLDTRNAVAAVALGLGESMGLKLEAIQAALNDGNAATGKLQTLEKYRENGKAALQDADSSTDQKSLTAPESEE